MSSLIAHYLHYLRPQFNGWLAALGHTLTPFCFVIRQFLGFFPCRSSSYS